ncbi:carbohydrate ABC transporter permease [Jatrophihabitans sp.]|jgi:raffinose/stachyose/melibiose transport system permease protein|uniref:carbohydrate ABC transporter permease n=1 Tax=Jatrophihabitans sp. TaxID=1932789 RepID=UPI002F074A29
MTSTRTVSQPKASIAQVAGKVPVRPPRRGTSSRTKLELLLLLAPALALFVLFVLAPMVAAIYYSFYHWTGFGPLNDFVGLDNYRKALSDPIFQGAIWHNVLIAVLSLVVQLPLSLGLALLLNGRIHGRALLRTLVFAPYVLSEAITAVLWLSILQPGGAVDKMLAGVGLKGLTHEWLADRGIVLYTLFAVITWKYIGFGIILFLAGLQGVPPELKEAAAIDGATSWQTTRRVVIPLLGPTVRIWAFLSIIGALQLFDLIWIMTLGGPAGSSATMATYLIDRGFRRYQFGYGSAVTVILFTICFVFALLYQRFALRRDTQGAITRRAGA